MKFSGRYLLRLIVAVAILAVTSTGQAAQAAGEATVSHAGVTVRILETPLAVNTSLEEVAAPTLSADEFPRTVVGYPVLETKTAVVACDAEGGLTFWTRRDGRLIRRAAIGLAQATGSPQFRLLADDKRGIVVEVGLGNGQPNIVALSKDGILEIRQPIGQAVVVGSSLRYVLVPSLVGTDLLFDPDTVATEGSAYLPSMNMIVGLADGNEGMLVGVWPPGEQRPCLQIDRESDPRRIESFSLDTAGESFYLAYLDHPGIWHEERLREAYLETDTAIAWQKPFEARWIGRFFIDSDGYDFPFYFVNEKYKLWGRYIRGWFYYPVWFEAGRTMVHFEKKFPPQGKLLVYYLDTYDDQAGILSAVGVMQRSLGRDATARLLDLAGTKKQVLLEHGNAVCAMTYKIESYCAREATAPAWAEVKQYTGDVATFIRLIRERVFQYGRFADEMGELLTAAEQERPAWKEALEASHDMVAEIRDIVESDLPDVPLEEVRAWTDEIRQLTVNDGPKNLAVVKALTRQCRSVAGTQDDMARNLSVVTIRLMEEAARMGTASADHARLAERIITRCRGVLREPSWWEPCRQPLPKDDPGRP